MVGLPGTDPGLPVALVRRSSGGLATPTYHSRRVTNRSYGLVVRRWPRAEEFCGLDRSPTVLPLLCSGRKRTSVGPSSSRPLINSSVRHVQSDRHGEPVRPARA